MIPFIRDTPIGECTETEAKQCCQGLRGREWLFNGSEMSHWGDENVLQVGRGDSPPECTKCHGLAYFKMVNGLFYVM